MSVVQIILGIVMLIVSLGIVASVLGQESKDPGMSGAITGGSSSYLGSGKGKSKDQVLKRFTTWLSIILFVLTIVVNVLIVVASHK